MTEAFLLKKSPEFLLTLDPVAVLNTVLHWTAKAFILPHGLSAGRIQVQQMNNFSITY